jgi:hypothetical protein
VLEYQDNVHLRTLQQKKMLINAFFWGRSASLAEGHPVLVCPNRFCFICAHACPGTKSPVAAVMAPELGVVIPVSNFRFIGVG